MCKMKSWSRLILVVHGYVVREERCRRCLRGHIAAERSREQVPQGLAAAFLAQMTRARRVVPRCIAQVVPAAFLSR